MAYTNAIYRVDLANGSDSARTTLTSVVYAWNAGTSKMRGNKTAHGLITGAVVNVVGGVLIGYWKVTRIDADNFDLDASTNVSNDTRNTIPQGGASWADALLTLNTASGKTNPGDIVQIAKSPAPYSIGNATWTNLSKTVTLASNTYTANVDMCETAWTAVTGLITVLNSTPTAGGSGYTLNDILTITTGGTNATCQATSVSGGVVTGVTLVGGGNGGYTTGTGKATSGGTGTGCTVNITTVASATVTRTGVATDAKEGSYCMQIQVPASAFTGSKFAYYAISPGSLTAYQNLSFWIKNGTAIASNTQWRVCLCSDASGNTIVDSFAIPAIPSTGQWIPLNIARTGGGNLGASTASIAIYTGSAVPSTSSNILIDDIIATKTNNLSLQTLISKNSLEQGGTEGWYGIQSINGTSILLDNDVNCKANAGRGYSTLGTSPETVTTYGRETIKQTMQSSQASYVNSVTVTGTSSNPITFTGGYNTSNSNQDGETFLDNQNGFSAGFYIGTPYNYITVEHINCYRASIGIYEYSSNVGYNRFQKILSLGNNQTGFVVSGFYDYIEIQNSINNSAIGIQSATLATLKIGACNNNLSIGLTVQNAYSVLGIVTLNNNGSYGFQCGSYGISKLSIHTLNNATAGVGINIGSIYLQNSLIEEVTEAAFITPTYQFAKLYSNKHDQVLGNNWIFTTGGTINSQTDTRHTASGIAWKLAPSSSRLIINPIDFSVAKVAVKANIAITFSCWVKKDHATNVQGQLLLRGGQIAGIDNDVSTLMTTSDTNWNKISLATVTPTEDGVIEIVGQGWYVGGVSYVYFDDFSYA